MPNFQNIEHNKRFRDNFFEAIIDTLIDASEKMVSNVIEIENDENKIRDHLLNYYLNDNVIKKANYLKAHFEPEAQENYIDNKYLGRVDIRVIGENIFYEPKNYYNIECKRIDGSTTLNTKYINNGINRFVIEKYTSYNNKNIMFGFVVKDIDIKANAIKINDLQISSELNKNSIKSDFIEKNSNNNTFALYSSEYITCTSKHLELSHLFYNFHSVI